IQKQLAVSNRNQELFASDLKLIKDQLGISPNAASSAHSPVITSNAAHQTAVSVKTLSVPSTFKPAPTQVQSPPSKLKPVTPSKEAVTLNATRATITGFAELPFDILEHIYSYLHPSTVKPLKSLTRMSNIVISARSFVHMNLARFATVSTRKKSIAPSEFEMSLFSSAPRLHQILYIQDYSPNLTQIEWDCSKMRLEHLEILFEYKSLTRLKLNGAHRAKILQAGIQSLENLQELSIRTSLEYLEGEIPTAVGKLLNLKHFSLELNKLQGSIPREIGNLTQLTVLNLQHNKLSGRIPKEIGSLQQLEVLRLTQNSLSGPIPVELFSLRNLRDLSLANNLLEGSIPPEIGQMRNLTKLELQQNALFGPIPRELTLLNRLMLCDLTKNEDLSCVFTLAVLKF
ncbi:hypothetical protein BDR26DRAFT_854262, partial [Obelidium mucronatum]